MALASAVLLATALAAGAGEPEPAWARAHLKGPMSAEETRVFMRKLAQFVFDHHLKKSPDSPQRGMIYEYFDTTRKGQFDQWVQGEALDTMHDGAWFAAALVNAYRATGDPFYKDFLTQWVMPFYCKMLNHSDELFSTSSLPKVPDLREGKAEKAGTGYPPEGVKPSGGGASPRRDDSRPTAHKFGKEWLFQEGEKGYVPYFWDDGGSVSYERRHDKNPLGAFQCVDHLAGKPNPNYLLNGYSLGSSNHMAQDLGVMLELAWLLFRDSRDERDGRVTAELAEAAKNLCECRMRHHGPIPMCVAPWALASGDAKLMMKVPDPNDKGLWTPKNHYTRALYDFEPGKPYSFPGFADDQEYQYYHGIARAGGTLPRPLAFRLIYDAYTHPMLFRYYCDDWEVPPGINVFDLFPYRMVDGRPTDYRSERKGPRGTVKPIGSRFGPQNMVVCGWALQALKTYPGIWEERYRETFGNDLRVQVEDWPTEEHPEIPLAKLRLGGVEYLCLYSFHGFLFVIALSRSDAAPIEIFSGPDGKGRSVIIDLTGHKPKLVNEKGETINSLSSWAIVPENGKPIEQAVTIWFSALIPNTALMLKVSPVVASTPGIVPTLSAVVTGQKPWANAIEHGRYSIRVGNETRNFYLASPEELVKVWLERELGGGLRTWEAIFNEKGYIPTSLGSTYDWDKYSDTGGYAHLLSAAAQWLFYLEGKKDWEIHRVPAVQGPKK